MEQLKEINKLVGQLEKTVSTTLNQVLTPDVMAKMSEEQKAMITQGREAFKFNGLSLDEKMEELQKTLKNVANINK